MRISRYTKFILESHAGFGMGVERLIMFVTKAQKIHDVIPFPVSY